MLKFKNVTIEDKAHFDPYLKLNSKTCDRTFVNIFCWKHLYNTEWTENEDWIIVRACINGERRVAYILISKHDNFDYSTILPQLENDAAENNHQLTIMGLSDDESAVLKRNYPDTFIFDHNRDFADYIYRREDFKSLRGRKFAQKRNHVNKFKTLYNYRYENLTKENISDCLELEESWIGSHFDDESALSEKIAIRDAFAHFDELSLIGGVLYVENQIVAFTYGSALNDDTFCTHVEKADIKYEGVYQMINFLFAQNIPEQFEFVNREEDMGLAGLRKSKTSYEPVSLAFKTTAVKISSDMRDIMSVWAESFGADDDSVFQFLSRYYFDSCAFVEKVDNKIVAMIFVVPCDTNAGKGAYIYGVATSVNFRRQGRSSRLIRQCIEKCRQEGFNFSFLISEDSTPDGFYEKFGYKKTETHVVFESDMDLGTGVAENDIAYILPLSADFELKNLPENLVCSPIL